jgi:hypothetical protein
VGPGSHVISLKHLRNPAAYSMARKYPAEAVGDSPGVGTYTLPSRIKESPGKSFSKKFELKTEQGTLGHGPASYTVLPKSTSHCYSMAVRTADPHHVNRKHEPGPGAYDLKELLQSPKVRIGTATRPGFNSGLRQTPGPG